MENDDQRNLLILFLFLILLINFFWINKEIKNIFNNISIFSSDQFIYIIILVITIFLIIFLKIAFAKIKKESIVKKNSENDYITIESNGNTLAIKGLEIQELKGNNQEGNIQNKFQTFISTLVKNKVPCIYTLSIMPLGGIKNLTNIEEIGSRIWLMTFGRSNEEVERNFIIMESALQTAFPKIYTKKIEVEDLRNFFKIFLFKKK